jgi:hypothetical protein
MVERGSIVCYHVVAPGNTPAYIMYHTIQNMPGLRYREMMGGGGCGTIIVFARY